MPDVPVLNNKMQSDELYRLQVRELHDYAMFMIDPNGVLLSWNAGVERLFGYSEDEWLGQHASIIFTPPENAEALFESEAQRAKETGSATDIRWHLAKGGKEFFANGFMTTPTDEKGELLGYSKIVSDETARKHLQDSLTESNAALEQFAYVASHDLQEPLRTMSTFSQLLRMNASGKLDEETDRILTFIISAADRMRTLVEDLLMYARIATEVDRPASVDLDDDLETAITHLSQAISESHAVVTHDSMPSVSVDRGQMVRLFQNLIGNALKYRKPDVTPQVHVAAEKKGAEWLISVRDNGIGFERRYAALIFSPFKRLHTAAEYPGTGVGLAICSRIVKMQGGRIWAESQPGEGSTFYFTLPMEGRTPPPCTPLSDTLRSGEDKPKTGKSGSEGDPVSSSSAG